ncbi:pyruvate formate lyase family protein [Eudoraea adriatica]|uniref:pyruvate formate lyase family protein n=1 Tax=Eudoraea adriatica TaxID=446681 RepID=UPI00035CF80A|nr:pyruvate formate lyase family protein [Eudoraea adriatica]
MAIAVKNSETKSDRASAVNTGRVNADTARIDQLKEVMRSTPAEVDFERIIIMKEVYENTEGYPNVIRRARFNEALLDRKKLYIDDNLFVGAMASTVNGIYTYPEWQVGWMIEEKVVENSKTPELKAANQWVLDYWGKRAQVPRVHEIYEKRYGYDARPIYQAGLVADFFSWPAGGGNLDYPRVYREGLASMIKEVEERMMSLEMRLPNKEKFYFYEAGLITMKAILRYAKRYAALAREMAAKEKNEIRKAELISLAETCEWVPEHPARNLREAMQSHFFCHIVAEIEQVGCGYSEAYLGQNLEPYYQADKAAGLINYEDAVFMFENLVIKLNEIGYYFGEKVALQNSADLGQSITLGGYDEEGDHAHAEMDFVILDACNHLHLPQPPLSLCYTNKTPGKLLEKVLDVIGTGIGMPQFISGDAMFKRALHMWGHSKNGDLPLSKARRTCVGACVGSYIPYETGHPVEGQPNLGKVLELTLNDGFDPRTKKQIGPKTGDPETFKDFEELYAAFEKQLQFCEDVLRRGAWIASMLAAEYLPVTWRSLLTGGCIESGIDVWNGGANYYTVAQISVGSVDAGNGLMAVKHLIYDKKKLTWKELKAALAANFEGEYERVHKMVYVDAPKYGNNLAEPDHMVRRVNDSILAAFKNVDGGGNYITRDIKTSLDQYTKSVHNLMGKVTGALPTGKKAGLALTDGSLSAMPGTDVNGPTALVMSATVGNDAVKWTATHMNMKVQPDQLKTRKGRDQILALVKTLFDNGGYHIQFNCLDTEMLRDAQKHPENYRDLVVRVAGFSAFFTKLDVGVQNEVIERTLQTFN